MRIGNLLKLREICFCENYVGKRWAAWAFGYKRACRLISFVDQSSSKVFFKLNDISDFRGNSNQFKVNKKSNEILIGHKIIYIHFISDCKKYTLSYRIE